MPLWLLLRQAEHDSYANKFIHQRELYNRVHSGVVEAEAAPRIVKRILRWQADPTVEYWWAGDALYELSIQGYVSEEQQHLAWANAWLFELEVPETVEPGSTIPLAVHAMHRAGYANGLPVIWEPWLTERRRNPYIERDMHLTVDRLSVDGEEIPLTENHRSLFELSYHAQPRQHMRLGWNDARGPWNVLIAPSRRSGAGISIELEVSWDFTMSSRDGILRDPEQQNRSVTVGQWLAHRGVPTRGEATLRTHTQIVPKGSIVPTLVDRPEVNEWLADRLTRSVLTVRQNADGTYQLNMVDQKGNRDTIPDDPPVVFGRTILHHGGWSIPLNSVADHLVSGTLGDGHFSFNPGNEVLSRYIIENPTGWELEIIAEPERSLFTANRPAAWAGKPIRVPIGVEINHWCADQTKHDILFYLPQGAVVPQKVWLWKH